MILLFPGQGSQFIGMGKELHDHFQVAKLLFEEVNDAISYDLSKIMFDGPEDQLSITKNTQPAIMAVSMAVVKVLEQELGKKISEIGKYVMGHSLGEYSALCAVGTLSVIDTAKLLKIRGQAMQEATPIGMGTMLALLGVDVEQVEEIIKPIEGCEIANDNGGRQVVVSCLTTRIEDIKSTAKKHGVKRVIPLPVSAPFHSTFMQPAADAMQEAINNVVFNPPALPIISNVTARAVKHIDEIKKGLIEQIVQRVRWRESVLYCNDQKAAQYVELGPGNVLTNLVKRILPEKPQVMNICNSTQVSDFISQVLY